MVFPGDAREIKTWSGVPGGIAAGLAALGVEVVHLSAELPRPIRVPVGFGLSVARVRRVGLAPVATATQRSRLAVKEGSREFAALRTLALRARVGRLRPPPPLVQIGTGYTVPAGAALVTMEDMTIAQAVELGLMEWRAQTPTTLEARTSRQQEAYARAVGCCAASEWAARSMVDDYHIPRARVHVVGFGRNHEPRPLDRDWSEPRFLFIGKEWERKGGPAVLRAFARLREQIPSARLDVVGLHPRIDLAGVTGHRELGRVAGEEDGQLEGLFETATCCVMPSSYEPFGIVHAEAAAAGVPSIGSTVGGAADPIGPDGGRLVPPGDDRALLEAMRTLADPETAQRMGAAALARSPRFTWRAVAARIIAVLQGTADSDHRPGPAPAETGAPTPTVKLS